MADQNDKLSAIPMITPDMQARMIPIDKVGEAALHGLKPAVKMASADGDHRWVPADRVEEGLHHGFQIVQNNGEPYPKDEEPIIVGHNEAGQPIWGSKSAEQVLADEKPQGSARDRLVSSAKNVLEGAAKGLFDLRPNEYEQQKGLTSWMDYPLRPFERAVEGQVQEGEEAKQLVGNHDYMRGVAHGLAALLPMLGPWAAEASEQASQQLAHGDVSGAIGTLGGNAAVGAIMEGLPKAARFGGDLAKDTAAEMVAPESKLNRPVGPEQLSPRDRWEAANRAKMKLDLAQATDSSFPGRVKRFNEDSLAGGGRYDVNREHNLDALQKETQRILTEAHPDNLSREEFGNRVQKALREHRAQLADTAGTQTALENLLNQADPRSMSPEEFGDAAREALEKHRQGMLDQERGIYEGLDKRLGDQGPNMDLVRQKARGIYDKNKRFYDNHPEALKGGDARVWAWVKDLAGVEKEKASGGTAAAAKAASADTWADLQTARSHLLDITRGPDFVGDLAAGWAKQLTGAIDETMTSAEKTPGLTAKDVKDFRDANNLHKRVKELYDNPQSPFYWAARDEGSKVATRLNSLSPVAARDFRQIMDAVDQRDLIGQQQRQAIQELVDPARNGEPDFKAFPKRWKNLDKSDASELFATRPELMNGLDALSQRATKTTPYDEKPLLKQIVEAPDGMRANDAMFTGSGDLRLNPADVRVMEQADPELVPQLRRQAISRLLDPAGNGTPDLQNFSARWKRTDDEPLENLLTPEQIQQLDAVSALGRTVQAKNNPSGTAVSMKPFLEAGSALSAGAAAVPTALMGHPGVAAATIGAPVVENLAQYATSRSMNSPDVVRSVMEHEKPTLASMPDRLVEAVKEPGLVTQPIRPAETVPGAAASALTAAGTVAATSGAGQPTRDRFAEMTKQRTANPEGVSTPPNEGQITSLTNPEPNEVHDAAKEAAILQEQQQHGQGTVGAGGASGVPGGNVSGKQAVDVKTGASSSGKLGIDASTPNPQSKLEAPEGATHEVLGANGETLGHIVDGEYVPLEGGAG